MKLDSFDLSRLEKFDLEKLNKEKEVIGIYLSSHPLDDFKLEISTFTTATLADLQNLRDWLDRDVVVAGMVTDTRNGIGKNGKPYGSFTVQDYSDSFRFMLFDKDYIENSKYCTIGYYLLINGRVQVRKFREDEIELKIKKITLLSSVKDELIKSVTLKIDPADITNEMIRELKELVSENKGETELRFEHHKPQRRLGKGGFKITGQRGWSVDRVGWIHRLPGLLRALG